MSKRFLTRWRVSSPSIGVTAAMLTDNLDKQKHQHVVYIYNTICTLLCAQVKLCGFCCLVCAVVCVVITVTTTVYKHFFFPLNHDSIIHFDDIHQVVHMNRLQTLRECVYNARGRSCTCFTGSSSSSGGQLATTPLGINTPVLVDSPHDLGTNTYFLSACFFQGCSGTSVTLCAISFTLSLSLIHAVYFYMRREKKNMMALRFSFLNIY